MTSAVDKYIKFNSLKVTLSVFQCTFSIKKHPWCTKSKAKSAVPIVTIFWESQPSLHILYFEKLKYLMHCVSPVVQYNHIRYLV